jgi:transcriptional regulator with XRE-family HTH domain
MFENKIKELRKYFGLTQTKFGKSIGKSLTTIQYWESGKSVPDDSTIQLICMKYNVNEQWLRTGQGQMFKQKETATHQLGDFSNVNYAQEVTQNYHGAQSPIADLMKDDIIKLNELILEVGTPKLLKKFIKQLEEIKKITED